MNSKPAKSKDEILENDGDASVNCDVDGGEGVGKV